MGHIYYIILNSTYAPFHATTSKSQAIEALHAPTSTITGACRRLHLLLLSLIVVTGATGATGATGVTGAGAGAGTGTTTTAGLVLS